MRTEAVAAERGAADAAAPAARPVALWPGLALAMAGSIAFSGKAIIVKLAYRYGVDAVTLIMYRMLFALPLFALLAWWAGRGKPALTRRDWLVVSGLGFSGYYLAELPRLRRPGLHHGEPRAADPVPQPDAGAGARRDAVSSASVTRAAGRSRSRSATAACCWCSATRSSFQGGDVALGRRPGVRAARSAMRSTSSPAARRSSGSGALRLTGLATSVACLCCIVQFLLLRPLVGAGGRARGDLAVGAERDALHVRAGADGDDGDRAHRRQRGRADRHDRAALDDPDGRADPRRAVHRVDRSPARCWCSPASGC